MRFLTRLFRARKKADGARPPARRTPHAVLSLEPLEAREVPTNLIFFGNSYTVVDDRPTMRLDHLVRDVAAAAGQGTPFVNARTPGGTLLSQHAAAMTPALVQGFMPPGQAADAVVMQGQSLETTTYFGSGNPANFMQGARDLSADVRGAFPQAKLVLLQTWARPNPSDQPAGFPVIYPTSFANQSVLQNAISNKYVESLGNLRTVYGAKTVEMAPAGEAFRLLGFNPNLYFDNGGHQNPRGALAAALTVYATVYDDNVSDISIAQATPLLVARGLTGDDWLAATSAADRAMGNLHSAENLAFVRKAYTDILARTADTAGENYWLEQLNAGHLNRPQVAARLVSSEEYNVNFVQGRYQFILNRPADTGGLNLFVGQLRNGAAVDSVRMQMFASDEFFNTSGGTNAGLVQKLYEKGLSRAASTGEVTYWVNRMNTGLSRFGLVESVINSRENRERQVRNLYTSFFNRPADAGGLNLFATALQTGTRFQDVVVMMLQSPEYYLMSR